MAVRAIQTNEYKSHQASYTTAAAIGALGGYALKYISPLTKEERDEKSSSGVINSVKKNAKSSEIDAYKNIKDKTPAVDHFVKMSESGQIKAKKIKALGEPLSSQVLEIISNINAKARKMADVASKILNTTIKEARPTKTFMGIGAAVALSTAFVYNVLGKISEN